MRTHPSQMPSADEYRSLEAAQAVRPVPTEQVEHTYATFGHTIRLLQLLDVPTDFFTEQIPPDEIASGAQLPRQQNLADLTAERLLARPPSGDLRRACDEYFDYHAEEDAPALADMLFVFGASTMTRAEKAVELYHAGIAPRILVSGRTAFYREVQETEAARYRAYALAHGVPAEAVIAEDNSCSILDNIRRSLNLLDELGIAPTSWVSIAGGYCQRRASAHLRKHLPLSHTVLRVNAAARPEYEREAWFRNEVGIRILINESLKLRTAALLGTA